MKKLIPHLTITLFLIVPLVVNAAIVQKPLTENDVARFLGKIANYVYVIGLALALVIIVAGAIMYMTAGGSDDKISKAKKFIITGLIGTVILILAGVIISTVKYLIETAL